jgi:hypothetical protein
VIPVVFSVARVAHPLLLHLPSQMISRIRLGLSFAFALSKCEVAREGLHRREHANVQPCAVNGMWRNLGGSEFASQTEGPSLEPMDANCRSLAASRPAGRPDGSLSPCSMLYQG